MASASPAPRPVPGAAAPVAPHGRSRGQDGVVTSGEVSQVRVEVLGPIRVRTPDGRDATPDSGLQRRLLALLVLRRGQVVDADVAVEALWPAALPKDPGGALQNHVSRLRRCLPDGAVESVGTGYRLDPARVAVDADLLAGTTHERFSIRPPGFCISLGRRDAVIQPYGADERPTSTIYTGRLGAFIKESICRYTLRTVRMTRHWAGVYHWFKRVQPSPRELPASTTRLAS